MNPEIITDTAKRHDFLLLFDVTDGNPNGDPDAGNMPRIDPENGQGLVTDVCLKRKIRNYVEIAKPDTDNYRIYVREKAILSKVQGEAYAALNLTAPAPVAEEGSDPGDEELLMASPLEAKGKTAKRPARKAEDGQNVSRARDWMCAHFYDIRLFGAVMSLKENNAGQVRGPVQLTFARSVSPIVALDVSITRMAVATEKEAEAQGGDNRTMGRKAILPYGLYLERGFYSPAFAKQTGVTSNDLTLLWEALQKMWEVDRSASRGMMCCRGLYVLCHDNPLGSAPAHQLLERFEVRLREGSDAPRRFQDYVTYLNDRELPTGVTLTKLTGGE